MEDVRLLSQWLGHHSFIYLIFCFINEIHNRQRMIRNMDQAFTCLNIQLVNTASLSDVQKEQYCEYFDRCSKCDLSHVFCISCSCGYKNTQPFCDLYNIFHSLRFPNIARIKQESVVRCVKYNQDTPKTWCQHAWGTYSSSACKNHHQHVQLSVPYSSFFVLWWFFCQIADWINTFKKVLIWLWCSILTLNVPPTTMYD